ncbi:nicotinamide mononucleotide deamidase-related protein YfaY [Enterobacteriaceae bacterium H20N1]|uniref:CinA-like protein n=1 Tax=Dryocola boscaweniae TaxID=2925397 RepID=A0A9X2W7J0_9ENTR|nr:nicotinamide mononucleotide deamidase-related protein YfaY [Dryocola boscaweniae]MCT4702435.1 nicotinamide mononucleotide deamidase-related protein YfaY [Dryocola boscaweniae]MCT4719603.1 nicotinamide mononucleotide deamidase-related protein YfaY [Dryocola boscaweniae]
MIKVEMLSTGDEVLYGQIVDTNAAWLADYLFNQGLPMSRRNTVGDSLEDLIAVLKERSEQADILIVNGGLGPTSDDLSALAAARAAGVELVEHKEWLTHMEQFFSDRGRVMAPSNRKQALIPANSEMVDNPVGTACGFAMTLNRCLIFFTPGVPSEFKVMVDKQIMPRLRERFTLPEPPVCLRLTTFGRSESELAQSLDPLALPAGAVMGYRSSMPIIELKLTGPASLRKAMEAVWPQVQRVAGESVIFEGTEGLPAQLAERLKAKGLSIAIGERFTAGLLCQQLSNAQAPLGNSSVLSPVSESLSETAERAKDLAAQAGCDLALVVGSINDDLLNFALHTPTGTQGLCVKFNVNRHGLRVRQEVCAMMALNMLRRWLNGWDVAAEHGWINIVEAIEI